LLRNYFRGMRLPAPPPTTRSLPETSTTNDKLSGDSATSISMTSSEESDPHNCVEDDGSGKDRQDDDASDEGEYEVELNDKTQNDDEDGEDGEAQDDNGNESGSEEMSIASFSAINFTEFVEMYEIDCEYSPDEEAIMWFNSEEYAKFLEHCEDRANEITKQHEAKGEEISSKKLARDLLGLEAWTKEGYKKRQKARLTSIDVVLDAQFAQWDDGKENPDSIAELYRASTADSALTANTKAKHLERDVKGFLQSTLKNYDLVRTVSTNSMSSFRSKSSTDSISSGGDDDKEASDEENATKKKVVKKKVVKKKSSDSEWTKVDPHAPQPYNKYIKKVPSKKNPPSLMDLETQGSARSLMSSGSTRSINSASSCRGPVSLTPSPPNSIRSMGSRTKAPPKNKSLSGRRKPEALAAASRLQRQSGSRSIVTPQKHQPSNNSVNGGAKKQLVKKKPQLSTVSVVTKKPVGSATPMRVPLSKTSKPKSMKFIRSEVLPAYNTPVSATTDRKNILARKKKSLQEELKMIEKEMKSAEKSSFKIKKPASTKKVADEPEKKKKGGLLSKRLLGGKG
jgi:hypothetical protein